MNRDQDSDQKWKFNARMNTCSIWRRCGLTIAFIGLLVCTAAAQKANDLPDASWVRDFASPSQGSEKGRENQLNLDPRFHALLQSSLQQHQFFWRDHGRFTPVPDLVQTFIGVPGSVLLDQNRYVIIDGCVPHDCGDRGLVWIDIAPAKRPPLIFVATGDISNGPGDRERQIHLWLFSSTPLNFQKMPPQFLSIVSQWWNRTSQGWDVPERIVLVTLVQPTGEMVDLSPSIFTFNDSTQGAKK